MNEHVKFGNLLNISCFWRIRKWDCANRPCIEVFVPVKDQKQKTILKGNTVISLVTYNDDKNGNHKHVFKENSVSVDCDIVAHTIPDFDHDNVKLMKKRICNIYIFSIIALTSCTLQHTDQ